MVRSMSRRFSSGAASAALSSQTARRRSPRARLQGPPEAASPRSPSSTGSAAANPRGFKRHAPKKYCPQKRQARPRLGPRQWLQKARSEEVLPPEAGPPPPRAAPEATAGGGADLASFPARASSRSSGTSAKGGASRQRPRQGHQPLTLARGRAFHHSLIHLKRARGAPPRPCSRPSRGRAPPRGP